MSKEYYTDNLSDETMAKLIDEMLRFEKNKKLENKKINLLKIIPAVAAIVLVIGLINILPMFGNFSDNNTAPIIGEPVGEPTNDLNIVNQTDRGDRIQGDSYTFLLVGRDSVGGNTDTIMIAMFDVKNSGLSIMSIPRDTYVNTNEFSGKINAVFPVGYNQSMKETSDTDEATKTGMDFLRNTIQYTLGIPIDKYILMDTSGFRYFVDAIGGIDIEVPIKMDYDDPYQNLHIHLDAGYQHLDGDKAEQLVRFRSGYSNADIGRIEMQQVFMAALIKKALNLNNISALFDTSSKYISTNISGSDFAWFALKAVNVKLENMRVHTIAGEWVSPYYYPYKDKLIEIIQKYYNPYKQEMPAENFHIYDYDRDSANYNPDAINIDGITMDMLISD